MKTLGNIHIIVSAIFRNKQKQTKGKKMTKPKDELTGLQEANALRAKLKRFLSAANPVSDEEYDGHPFYRSWNDYMVSAAKSHDLAKHAFQLQDDCSAFWNAVHAMAAYAAANALVKHTFEPTAHADATYNYFNIMDYIRERHSELYNAFAKRPSQE
jgi:hypothetical protein